MTLPDEPAEGVIENDGVKLGVYVEVTDVELV